MERLVAKYSGAAAMYLVSKKLKKRHNITDERAALYEAAKTWVDALKGRPYCGKLDWFCSLVGQKHKKNAERLDSLFWWLSATGGVKPNLADLAVFGVLRPIRHLQSGKDMVDHTRIGEWYDRMQRAVGDSARVMT